MAASPTTALWSRSQRSALAALSVVLLCGASAPDPQTRALIDESVRLTRGRAWAATDSVALLALARAEAARPPDSASMALALYLRGNMRLNAVRLQDPLARSTLDRSIEICERMRRPDTLTWARTLILAGRLAMEQDRPQDALDLEARARRLCSPTLASSDSIRADAWITTGRTYRRLHEYDDALAAFEQARALRERAMGPEHPLTAATLTELGAVYVQSARFPEAASTLETAVTLIERGRGPTSTELVVPLGHVANLQYQLGDIAGSVETIDRQIAILTAAEGPGTVRTLPQRMNRASRLFDFGDYTGALEEYRRLIPVAETAFGPTNSRTRDIETFAGIAALIAGDTAAAATYLDGALALHRARPDDPQMHAWTETWISGLQLRRGDAVGARALADTVLAHEGTPPYPDWLMAHVLEKRLDACMKLGDQAGVRATVARFDALAAKSAPASTPYVSAQRLNARALAWLGEDDAAWARALRAEEIERRKLESNIRALPDRHGLQLANELAEPLDLLVTLADPADPARLETAWDRIVRWRGMVAAEMTARRVPREASGDTAIAGAHARWMEARRMVAIHEVAAVSAGDSASGARLQAARAADEEAERRYAVAAGARGLPRDTAEVTLADVRAALLEGQGLVSIVEVAPRTDTSRVVAFIARGRAAPAQRVELGDRASLQATVDAWRAALATPPAPGHEREAEQEVARRGEAMRARVWTPLRQRLGETREVVIVADGVLAGLPWAALPDGRRYLAETGPIFVTPGAERDLLQPAASPGAGLLAIGDPDFDAAAPGSAGELVAMRGPLAECRAATAMELTSLPGARAELKEVAETWTASRGEATTRVGAEATERAVKEMAPRYSVLHLATHGIVWGDSCAIVPSGTRGVGGVSALGAPAPSKSASSGASKPAAKPPGMPAEFKLGRRVWLALAGANRPRGADENEGLLTAEEVASLDLRGVSWVVLSACHSGVGETWPREGSLGMQRAFRLAGARCVIASQWAVADQSTREWMHAFYVAGAKAGGPSQMVAAASRSVLEARRRSNRTLHPFYWAAFTSSGR